MLFNFSSNDALPNLRTKTPGRVFLRVSLQEGTREDVPEAQSLVSSASDDGLTVGGIGKIQDAKRVIRNTFIPTSGQIFRGGRKKLHRP